jgi:ubiquinone/menaquinone biosynthesis C-methylase UbiE
MNDAKLYHKSNEVQKRDAKSIIEEFSPYLDVSANTDRKLLDIGCGDGDVLAEIVVARFKHLKKVVGTDITSEMIQFARKHYENDIMSFVQCDFGSDFMSLKNGEASSEMKSLNAESFDLITSFFCLHWIHNQR